MSDRDSPFEDELFEDPILDSEPLDAGEGEYEKVEDETELCDCDPEHKESQPIQRSRGVSLGTFGGKLEKGRRSSYAPNVEDASMKMNQEVMGQMGSA